jgi:hypothetical protein
MKLDGDIATASLSFGPDTIKVGESPADISLTVTAVDDAGNATAHPAALILIDCPAATPTASPTTEEGTGHRSPAAAPTPASAAVPHTSLTPSEQSPTAALEGPPAADAAGEPPSRDDAVAAPAKPAKRSPEAPPAVGEAVLDRAEIVVTEPSPAQGSWKAAPGGGDPEETPPSGVVDAPEPPPASPLVELAPACPAKRDGAPEPAVCPTTSLDLGTARALNS